MKNTKLADRIKGARRKVWEAGSLLAEKIRAGLNLPVNTEMSDDEMSFIYQNNTTRMTSNKD